MNKFAHLRKQAEEILKTSIGSTAATHDVKTLQLLHELDTYQIELELQQRELQETHNQSYVSKKISFSFRPTMIT